MTLHPAVLWRATRAYSLPASVVPVLLGTVLAFRGDGGSARGHFDGTLFLVVLLGSILAHFGANVLNDYFDFILGVDTRPEHGSGVLTGGHMTARETLVFGLALLIGAAGCGLFVGVNRVAVVMPLALLGLGCAVLYPALLKKYALGDLLIVLAFGLGLTLGAYGVQAGSLTGRAWWQVSLFSVPVCLLVDAILHANNLRDAPDDRAAKVHTMATVFSPRGARLWHQFLLFGPLMFVGVGVAARLLPLWSLGSLLTFPLVLRAYRSGSVAGTAQSLRELVSATLVEAGYAVIAAASGLEALALWELHSERIDLLLTDMVMPEGVSGRHLAERLSTARPGLKIIYTSGYSLDLTDPHFADGREIYFLEKPYRSARMLALVRECLEAEPIAVQAA